MLFLKLRLAFAQPSMMPNDSRGTEVLTGTDAAPVKVEQLVERDEVFGDDGAFEIAILDRLKLQMDYARKSGIHGSKSKGWMRVRRKKSARPGKRGLMRVLRSRPNGMTTRGRKGPIEEARVAIRRAHSALGS